jgi:hypothetical protein
MPEDLVNDALALFGLAAALCSLALVISVIGRLWIRGKAIEQATASVLPPDSASRIVALLAEIETRLGRLEQSAEVTGTEVERLAEAHRFTARLLANGDARVKEADVAPSALASQPTGDDFH